MPGLVDLQVNGYAGVDFLSSEEDGWRDAGRALARDGVTSYVANLITAPPQATARALATAAAVAAGTRPGHARCLGAHLEGPFLAERRRGTHPLQYLLPPSRAALEPLLGTGPVVGVTIAPELPQAVGVISWLSSAGYLVALGHSDATAEEAHAGFDAGARAVTHVFNGMSGLTSRGPGLAGVALVRDGVAVQAIFDGCHLSTETEAVVVAAAGSRLVLVTDAVAAAGAPDGSYQLGDMQVTRSNGRASNADGGLAGSVASLSSGIRRALDAGMTLEGAVAAASSRPAELLHRDDLGRLRPGDPADVVVLDDALGVTTTYVGGQVAQ